MLKKYGVIETINRIAKNPPSSTTNLDRLRAAGLEHLTAEAIVLERVRNGPFRRIEDLDRVDGLGPETVEELRPFVRVGGTDQGPR